MAPRQKLVHSMWFPLKNPHLACLHGLYHGPNSFAPLLNNLLVSLFYVEEWFFSGSHHNYKFHWSSPASQVSWGSTDGHQLVTHTHNSQRLLLHPKFSFQTKPVSLTLISLLLPLFLFYLDVHVYVYQNKGVICWKIRLCLVNSVVMDFSSLFKFLI